MQTALEALRKDSALVIHPIVSPQDASLDGRKVSQ